VIFRRNRFADLVRRQLDLFAAEETALFAEADEAERAYDAADREDAEEAYADFQLVLDAARDRLDEIRTTYAATLDEDAALQYEEAFTRAARKRYPRFAAEL
jgi:hypothetical protein